MTEKHEEQVISFRTRCWVLLKSQGAHIVLFLIVNVVFGALGFLVPIAIEYATTLSFVPALQKQLNAAGAYTFAIAFLASSISLVAAEYLDSTAVAEYRRSKVLLSACAALIMIICAVFSGSQTARSLVDDSRAAQFKQDGDRAESQGRQPVASVTPDRGPAPQLPKAGASSLSSLDYLQVVTTAIAVVVGLLLFFVFQYQAPNMQAQLATYTKKTEAEVGSLMDGLEVGRR